MVKSQRQAVENALKNANNPLWIDSATVKDNQSSYDRFLLALAKQRELSREELAQELANQLAKRADEQNRREIAENLKRQAGVDLQEFLGGSERVQERLQQLTTANVALIKSIPTQYLDKVELAVTQAIVKGDLNSELTKKIMEIGQSTESRAKLIARDQASKFNAALTQARHEDLGITHYRWSTSGDERVRESHIENDGKIFAYDDPPEETGHPGFSINCRCVAIPVLDKAEIERAGQVQAGKLDLYEETAEIIDHKSWTPEFKTKAKNTFSEFYDSGVLVDVHGIARFLQRFSNYSVQEMVDIINEEEPNFIDDRYNRLVRFREKRKIAIIQSRKDKKIITFEKKSRVSKHWKKK